MIKLLEKINTNKYITNIISFVLIFLSISFSIFISFYAVDKRFIGKYQESHFYDMKQYYANKEFPTMGARFISTDSITSPKVPGGIYYIFYTLFYKLGQENLFTSKIINLIFNLIIISIFLFWFYKKFGIFITSIISAIFLLNPYLIMSITDFWNPNITSIFSLLLFIFIYEYIGGVSENIKKISATLIFPILALMAQGHFTVFFSMIPTLIIYLIARFSKTKKYILFWTLGVFISFLLYMPYLIHEINNNFSNLRYAMNMRGELSSIPFPQIYFLLLFPTNEMSAIFGTRIGSFIYFWFTKPIYIYGLIFLIINILFSVFVFVKSLIFLTSKKIKYETSEKIYALKEIILILILFIPVTIISFIIFKSKSGTFHYLYSAYSISFAPMILFFVQIENKIKNNIKIFSIIFALLVLNLFSVTGELIRYFNLFEEPRNYKSHYQLLQFLEKDSKNEVVYIYDNFSGILRNQYVDIFNAYFPNHKINFSPNAKIVYAIKDNIVEKNWDADRIQNDMNYLIQNNAIELTNIKGFTIYKFLITNE